MPNRDIHCHHSSHKCARAQIREYNPIDNIAYRGKNKHRHTAHNG